VHIDRAFVDLYRAAPHEIEQLRPREHAARSFEQIFEQPKINRSEANVAVAAPDAPGQSIEVKITGVKSLCDPLRSAAPEQGADAGHQFDHRKRLDYIIVRADRETAHALGFVAPGGDHDDRQCAGRLARPQTPADLDARKARQHPVENEEIRQAFSQSRLDFFAMRDAFREIALCFEVVGNQESDLDFVLDD
jgi:hypothetical protein